ncbi:hypothetical protein NVP1063O_058 [Vibrio phage 1.063.O._10N.261.45.C7]|nr:hypothetical protein NVP1063O_058 [Vibrio phage 1.063.O._10N.261.45.C7]
MPEHRTRGQNNTVYDLGGSSLSENIDRRARDFNRENLYIGIPAIVTSVDDYETLQCVDVQILINDLYTWKDNTILTSPKIGKVFVALPSGGGFTQKMPVSVGDKVRLCWAHRDLSNFLDGDGSAVDQIASSVSELEDCWVELGFGTRRVNQKPSKDNYIIEGPNTTITITPEGVVTVDTEGVSYLKSSHHTIDTDVTITKTLTVNGNTSLDKNLDVGEVTTSQGMVNALSGVQAASYAGVGGGAATFNVDMGVNGTVTINGININTHYHIDAEGRPTGVPQ